MRDYNSPLTDLGDPILVQIKLFNQPGFGVPTSFFMSNTREGSGDIYTPTSTMSSSGVSPMHVSV